MITPQWRPETSQLRQFAIVCLFGFPALGFVIWRFSGMLWPLPLLATIGVVVCLLGLVWPRGVYPVYLALLAVSLPVGWVVSGILLRLIFFGVITSVGLFFRLFKRDALALHRSSAVSYWRDLDPQPDATDYFRQA
jgi:hypothetical protein